MSGEPLGSRYVLEEELGRGGMGVVWRGRDRTDGRAFAIKLLRQDLAKDPRIVTRFVQERTALLRISHPNMVTVRDMIVEGDRLALVMDLVLGGDLAEYRARRGGTLAPVEAAALTAQVCDALAAAHAAGVVHRDIKPANVLMDDADPASPVRLADFGIAHLAEATRITSTDAYVGTAAYLAPEIIQGKRPGPAADLYAVGMTLYELLVGRTPFAGGHPAAMMHHHLNSRLRRLPAIPDVLWPLIDTCVAKDPGVRPSATDMAQALRAALPQLQGMPAAPPLPDDVATEEIVDTAPDQPAVAETLHAPPQALPPSPPPLQPVQPPQPLQPLQPLQQPTMPDGRWEERRTKSRRPWAFAGIAAACVAVAGIAAGTAVLASSSSSSSGKNAKAQSTQLADGQQSADAGQRPVQGGLVTRGGSASPTARASAGTASPKPGQSKSPGGTTGWCSPQKTFGDGAVLVSCFQTDHVHFVIKGMLSGIPAGHHRDQIKLILKDSSQNYMGSWLGPNCTPGSTCVFQLTVPLTLQHGRSYTVLPQRMINSNWVTGMSDGREPGMLPY